MPSQAQKVGVELFNSTISEINKVLSELQSKLDVCFGKLYNSFTNLVSKFELEIKDLVIKRLQVDSKLLRDRIIKLEHKLEVSFHYERRNNILINGLPNFDDGAVLENKVIDLLSSIVVNVKGSDIEACHPLPVGRENKRYGKTGVEEEPSTAVKSPPVVVRFENLKHANAVVGNSAKLKRSELIYFITLAHSRNYKL